MPRFRPRIERLEDRRTPALSVLSQDGDLIVSGTPEAATADPFVGWSDPLSVTRLNGDWYRVIDGAHDHGKFRVTRNISLNLAGFDNNVVVDLAGGRLAGDVTIDLGVSDRDPATANLVVVGGGGRVGGSVTLLGASVASSGVSPFDAGGVVVGARLTRGQFVIEGKTYHYTAAEDSPLTVGRDVTVVGQTGAGSAEDVFFLGRGSVVERDVITQQVAHTLIAGAVVRDVTALATDPEGLLNLAESGSVGRDLRYTATGTGGAVAVLFGAVGRDAIVTFAAPAGARSLLLTAGGVGRNMTVTDGAGDLEVVVGAGVGRDLVVDAGAGDDKVFITGDHDFRLDARMGGGDDEVRFAPDASVGSARIEFGTTGTDTLVLPLLVDFPLEVIHL